MHFKTWYSLDGFMGESVRSILSHTVDGANASQRYMNQLYENGLTARMAMQYTGDLSDEKVKKLQKKFADGLSGPQNAGKIVPVPIGLTLTPCDMSSRCDGYFKQRCSR